MICFCASCSSLSGMGAHFLYLWCMARVTNSQLMERFDEVNRRIDGQDETLKSIQSSLVELTAAVKVLVITPDKKEVKESIPHVPLIVEEEEDKEEANESIPDVPLIVEEEDDKKVKESIPDVPLIVEEEQDMEDANESIPDVPLAVEEEHYKEVKESIPDVPLIVEEEESDEHPNDNGEKDESPSAIEGENGLIRQISKKEYEEKRMNGHKRRRSTDALYDRDSASRKIIEESDEDKMSRFTPKPDLDPKTAFLNSSDSLNNWKMSGYSRSQCHRFASFKSYGTRKHTNAGPPSDLKPKTKVALDESCGGASSNQKADSSHTGECTSDKLLPPVKNTCFAKENLKSMPDSCHEANNAKVNRRTDGHDETLKSIQSSLVELASAVKVLVITPDKKEVMESIPHLPLIVENERDKKEANESIPDVPLIVEEEHDKEVKESIPVVPLIAEKEQDKEKANRSQGYHSASGRANGWSKQKNPEWKSNIKVALDDSCGGASSNQKDHASLSAECTSENMSSVNPKPDLNPHLVERSPLPPVKNPSYGIDNNNIKPIQDSSQRADNVSTQPKSVFTCGYTSKNSNHVYSIPTKSQQGKKLQDGIVDNGKQIGDISKREGSTHSSSITRFDICPKKDNTGDIKLKASLLEKNREKRIQSKRAAEGPNIYIFRPGMVLLKGYISFDDQVKIVKTCRELGIGDGGFYQPGYSNGAKLRLKMMCLGRNWDPQSSQYIDTRPIDNSKPPQIPDYFHDMVKRAIQDSNVHIHKNKGKFIPSMLPDICIVNFYTKGGRLGLHQDKDESRESLDRGLPVVSFYIGESADFLYGMERDVERAEKVIMESGDVLIFGGESRNIFNGVSSILADTASKPLLEATDMRPGHLNLSFRQF